jgi:hypothetical protein
MRTLEAGLADGAPLACGTSARSIGRPELRSRSGSFAATGTGGGGGGALATIACCWIFSGGFACADGAAPTNAVRDGATCAAARTCPMSMAREGSCTAARFTGRDSANAADGTAVTALVTRRFA